jgi:hypothetical protein
MNEPPQFVRSLLADKGSYVINGNASNEVNTQIEYKEVKSSAFEKLNLWSKGKVQIPRWLVKIIIYSMRIFWVY